MLRVREFYCIDEGIPKLAGLDWRRAVFSKVERVDPFTANPIMVPMWSPADTADVGEDAKVYGRADLAMNKTWEAAARALEDCSSALHDGLLFELWTVIIGEEQAASAWGPSWVTTDGLAQLIELPRGVTSWLAAASEGAMDTAISQWLCLPYLENSAADSARLVTESLVHVLAPLARLAREQEAKIVAEARGYVLP